MRRRELGKNTISFRVKTLLGLTRTPSEQNIRVRIIYIFISAPFTPYFFPPRWNIVEYIDALLSFHLTLRVVGYFSGYTIRISSTPLSTPANFPSRKSSRASLMSHCVDQLFFEKKALQSRSGSLAIQKGLLGATNCAVLARCLRPLNLSLASTSRTSEFDDPAQMSTHFHSLEINCLRL